MRLLLRFMGFLFAAGTIVFLVGVAGVAGMIWHYSKDLPDYSQLQDYEPPVMTRIHASDGALLGEYSKERRLYLPIQAIPKQVINAFLAAEDKNFYEHGVSTSPVSHALWCSMPRTTDRTGVRRARPPSPSRWAKNFLLTNEVSFTRKIKEALLAMRIERTYSKEKILELYLNEIYLGLGAYGIAAASLVLFRQVGERTDHRRSLLSRRSAESTGCSASGAQPRPRDRAAQLRDRPSG